MDCSEMHPCQTHSSPLEAAEAGTQTVGHSPQGCWPFRVAPPMPLSVQPCNFQSLRIVDPTMARRFAGVQLMRIIGEAHSAVKKIQQNHQREIGHLDKPTLRKQPILKTPFQSSAILDRSRPRLRRLAHSVATFGERAALTALQGRLKIIYSLSFRLIPREQDATEEEWEESRESLRTHTVSGSSLKTLLSLCGTARGARQARFWLAGVEVLSAVCLKNGGTLSPSPART